MEERPFCSENPDEWRVNDEAKEKSRMVWRNKGAKWKYALCTEKRCKRRKRRLAEFSAREASSSKQRVSRPSQAHTDSTSHMGHLRIYQTTFATL